MRTSWLVLLAAGCTEGESVDLADPATAGVARDPIVTELGTTCGYDDKWFGTYQRGRAAVYFDYDGDGKLDVYSANPGDTTYLLRNVSTGPGNFGFVPTQVFSLSDASWGGSAADYDNDGDQDLYIAYGGNDDQGFDRLLRNDLRPDLANVDAPFTLVSEQAGILPMRPTGDRPLITASMGSIWLDVDLDGLLDMWTNNMVGGPQMRLRTPQNGMGLNQLWLNQGNGTFEDGARAVGLTTQWSSRNSSVLDYDNDGDTDLFENNFEGPSILWHNDLLETGQLHFRDVTQEKSLGGGDMSFPTVNASFCTQAADLNNDGWDDLVVFRRGPKSEPDEPEVHANGHLVWINVQGTGFVEVADFTEVNRAFYWRDHDAGVMSCQAGDVNGDGFPDLFMGNGGPEIGGVNQLYASRERTVEDIPGVGPVVVPQWDDWTAYIDVPSPSNVVYPYRTHGSSFGDFDGDGIPELGMHDGGPMHLGPDEAMQEPNQLFTFDMGGTYHFLRVHLAGDGQAVNRDGIGARVHVRVARDQEPDLYQTRRTGAGFASQNEPTLFFGLMGSTAVELVEVTWPDGTVTTVANPPVDSEIVVSY